MQPQQRKHIGASPPYGEDTPDRRQVQRKEKEGGTSAKGSVLMLICVPLPHLVLPLSGCLSRRNPAMATRGEVRRHKSVVAQNHLFIHPPFPFFGLVVGLVCPRQLVDWPQCVCAAVDAFLLGFARWHYFVDMWVAEGHTQHDSPGCVCVCVDCA